jgi:hypothetical protein
MSTSTYTKVYKSILSSSVWRGSKELKVLWTTMLVMADKDGFVEATVPGLAHFAGLSVQETLESLHVLLSPDEFSRTKAYEGRRVEEIEGGWLIFNHSKYRDMAPTDDARAKHLKVRADERQVRIAAGDRTTDGATPDYGRSATLYYAAYDDVVKIGLSKNPHARVSELRERYPNAQLVAQEKGTEALKAARLQMFSGLRVAADCVKKAPAVVEFIDSLARESSGYTTSVVPSVTTTGHTNTNAEADIKSLSPNGDRHGEAVAIAESGPVCASLASAIHPCATVNRDGNAPLSATDEMPEEELARIKEAYDRSLEDEDSHAANASPVPTSHKTKGEGEKTPPGAKHGEGDPTQPTLKLDAEDEKSTGKKLPWGQIYHVFKRILPEIRMPSGGERRDRAMRRLWLANGKTITPFEQLAAKVAASDFLMARGTFSGPDDGPWRTGKPVTWGWIFDYDDQGRCRYERIMEGAYDNERMEKIRSESSARVAKPKLVPVMDVMNKQHLIDWNEMHNGKPRWEKQGIHRSGLPLVIDWASFS